MKPIPFMPYLRRLGLNGANFLTDILINASQSDTYKGHNNKMLIYVQRRMSQMSFFVDIKKLGY